MALNSIQDLLAQADKQRGFPAGTMASIMQQETGGNAKYLQDPSTYHYGLNAEGRRVAGHTGKVSTAFGPFGILESTGADPGYGVKPLQNKSLEEQVRFAGDYLAARSKGSGGLAQGLAGYGEGSKYSQQVLARLGKGNAPVAVQAAQTRPVPQQEIQVAALPVLPQEVVAQAPVQTVQEAAPTVVAQAGPLESATVQPEWGAFQQAMPRQVQASDLNYGQQMAQAPMQVAVSAQPNFNRFKAWGARV